MKTNAQSTELQPPGKRQYFTKAATVPPPRKLPLTPPSTSAKFYQNGVCEVHQNATMETVTRLHAEPGLLWLNIDGSHVPDGDRGDTPSTWLSQVQQLFRFHELALEDVRNRKQRAKLDRFDDGSCTPHVFVVARIPDASDPGETEQISIFFRDNLVVTIQESPGGDCLNGARRAARAAAERGILTAGLLVAEILDAAVMDYMAHLPGPETEIDNLQAQIGTLKTDALVHKLHHFRIEAMHLLRDLRPMEAVLSELATTTDDPLLNASARAKYKDALDHQRRAVDTLQHLSEESKELMNLTLAIASHKANEVMQVLAIVSAIFIPPTLIAGIYGMNFEHMPELRWPHGYRYVLVVIASISVFQIGLFWWKDWLVLPAWLTKRTPDAILKSKSRHNGSP